MWSFFSKIWKFSENHVFSSLRSNVSKVTSLKGHSVMLWRLWLSSKGQTMSPIELFCTAKKTKTKKGKQLKRWKANIARIANAVQCHNWLSGNNDCHEFWFSIVRIVIGVSNVTSLQDCLFNCKNCWKLSQLYSFQQNNAKICGNYVKFTLKFRHFTPNLVHFYP